MSEELEYSYPETQPWDKPTKVDWVNHSEPNLQLAGLTALGFENGFVVLVPSQNKIKVGDKVLVKHVIFRRPSQGDKGYTVSIATPVK